MRSACMLVLAALLTQDSGEVEQLLDTLREGTVMERDQAVRRLVEIGPSITPALRKALPDADAEMRAQIESIIDGFEGQERERIHDAAQRASALGLDKLADDPMEPCARTDGACFVFKTRGYDGGTILETTPVCHEGVVFDWDVAVIVDKDGKELAMERCGTCSPGLIYVNHPGPIYPRISGRRWWFSKYSLEFTNPCDGERRKIGDFTIEVDWPALLISSKRDWPVDVIKKVGLEFTCEWKPGEEANVQMFRVGGG